MRCVLVLCAALLAACGGSRLINTDAWPLIPMRQRRTRAMRNRPADRGAETLAVPPPKPSGGASLSNEAGPDEPDAGRPAADPAELPEEPARRGMAPADPAEPGTHMNDVTII